MGDKRLKLGLTKNVWIMGVVSLLNDLSSEIVYPLVPIFLTSILGAPASVVGLIEGIADASANFFMAISGFVSDKVQKRKPFIVTGYGLSTASKFILSVSFGWPMVLFSRITNRLGKGIRTTARDALIIESTGKTDRGRAFGFHRTLDNVGAILGPILSIVLLKALMGNYRLVFFWAFVPSAIAMLLLFFLTEKKKSSLDLKGMHFEWKKANVSFKLFLLISFIFAIGNSSNAFMILRAQNLGLSVSLTMLVYVLMNVSSSLFSIPAGILADRIGAKRVLSFGFLLFSYVYLMFGMADSSGVVWFLFPAYGLFLALTEGVGKAYLSRLIPHEIAGSAFGLYQVVIGTATFLASFIAGLMWTDISPAAPFIFGSVMAFSAAGLFYLLNRWIKVHPQSQPIPLKR